MVCFGIWPGCFPSLRKPLSWGDLGLLEPDVFAVCFCGDLMDQVEVYRGYIVVADDRMIDWLISTGAGLTRLST